MNDEMPAQYNINASEGLHRLKSRFNKTYMGPQCDQLLASLPTAIAATYDAAPVREQGYLQQTRTIAGSPAGGEAQWERAIWRQWSTASALPVDGAWHRIVTYQENLPAARDAQGWGEIDLLGVSSAGLPVVVELKVGGPESACEPVAAALVQAVAYAIVLQKAWPAFRENWCKTVESRFGVDVKAPGQLACCPVVVAATESYWQEWIGDTPRAKTVTTKTWQAFSRLVTGFAMAGYPASFVSLTAEGMAGGNPSGLQARLIVPHWWDRALS